MVNTKRAFACIFTSLLALAGNTVASPRRLPRGDLARGDIILTEDLPATDKHPAATLFWYGNQTQERLIAEAEASNTPLSTLDFLQGDPSVTSDIEHLQKRQCPTSGINCKFDLRSFNQPCQIILDIIDSTPMVTLPYFPHSICLIMDISGRDEQCCVAWTQPVLAYRSNIQFAMYTTYNHCTSGGKIAGVHRGIILGGVCQNVCVADTDTAYWCASG